MGNDMEINAFMTDNAMDKKGQVASFAQYNRGNFFERL